MAETSRAAVLDRPLSLGLQRRPKPDPGPGQVLVHFRATALCHTDLEIYTGRHPNLKFPIVMGHESTGVVEAIGPDVTDLAIGDSVILNPVVECGRCDMCQRGLEHCCRYAGARGREFEGSLAEHLALDSASVFKLPSNVPLELGTLIETLATVHHAQSRVRISPATSVAVLGTGTSGILHIQLARLAGADPIIGVSRTPWKLDLARERGATDVVNTTKTDPVEHVRRVTDGRGADVVIESSGSPAMLMLALEIVRPGGAVLLYGIGVEQVPNLTTFPFYIKELTIVGSRGLQKRDYPPAIELSASGRINLEGLITRTFDLDDVVAGFSYFEQNPQAVTRILIRGG